MGPSLAPALCRTGMGLHQLSSTPCRNEIDLKTTFNAKQVYTFLHTKDSLSFFARDMAKILRFKNEHFDQVLAPPPRLLTAALLLLFFNTFVNTNVFLT